jgi:hypothetical protein
MLLVFVDKCLVFKFGGAPWPFSHLGYSFPSGNVFLHYILRTMCSSSLGVLKKHFVCLFVCLVIFSCLFVLKIL